MTTTDKNRLRGDVLVRLEQEFELPAETIYLLHLAPLIEMLWADGMDQAAERELVRDYAGRLQAAWQEKAGTPVISDAAINAFLDRFLASPAEVHVLTELRHLLIQLGSRDPAAGVLSLDTVLDYCIDISACAVNHYPYGMHERVTEREKQLLKELVAEISALPCES